MVREINVSGRVMLVDDEDYEWLKDLKLTVASLEYAVISETPKRQLVHRVIMQRLGHNLGGMVIDHANHDPLDNRRENLRICTRSQNAGNAIKQRRANKTSKYKGVYWSKQRGKWNVSVQGNGEKHFLGSFDDETEAARAYNRAARELFGEFALINELLE